MSDDALLQEKARELVRAGRLPSRRPERIWGGMGSGYGEVHCALCGRAVGREETVLEVEVQGADGASYPRLHIRCFAAFEAALCGLDNAGPAEAVGHRNAA